MGNRLKKLTPTRHTVLLLAVIALILAFKPGTVDSFTEVRKYACDPRTFGYKTTFFSYLGIALGPGPYIEQQISGLKYCLGYRFQEKDRKHWQRLMLNKRANLYGRLCAAHFLIDDSQQARDFVERHLKHNNQKIRGNAGRILELYVDDDPSKMWGIDKMIRLLDDESLDDCGIKNFLCDYLETKEVRQAAPAIHRYLKREPNSWSAVYALMELDESRVIPHLMEGLKNRNRSVSFEIKCLAKLNYQPAIPLLLDRLNDPPHLPDHIPLNEIPQDISCINLYEVEDILEALLDFGDKRAIEPIDKFLDSEFPEETKKIARRVLLQLKETDPVPMLLEMLDSEGISYRRWEIMQDLTKYGDRRVVEYLRKLSQSSPSPLTRHDAIDALSNIDNKEALLALADLLPVDYVTNVEKLSYGKDTMHLGYDYSKSFPALILKSLRKYTQQDFGMDHQAWSDWISHNVE